MSYEYLAQVHKGQTDSPKSDMATLSFYELAAAEDGRPEAERAVWAEERMQKRGIGTDSLALWPSIAVPLIDISSIPAYSCLVQFPFRLRKPYLSKDEQVFHILENPVRRDKVFRLPFVAPTSWKGSLRAALREKSSEHEAVLRRLFGNEKEQEPYRAGRLRFFPSFFTQHGVEIINPHDSERRVGANPILIESVPSGAASVFTLLYVPFDLPTRREEEAEARQEVADDLRWIAQGIVSVLTETGFGAKTSSGYGLASDRFASVQDRRREHLPEPMAALKAAFPAPRPDAVVAFENDFGPLEGYRSEEWQELLNQDELARYEAAVAADQESEPSACLQCAPGSLAELAQIVTSWANQLTSGNPQMEGGVDER